MIKNTTTPCVIFELANVHGGNKDKLFAFIDEYSNFEDKTISEDDYRRAKIGVIVA